MHCDMGSAMDISRRLAHFTLSGDKCGALDKRSSYRPLSPPRNGLSGSSRLRFCHEPDRLVPGLTESKSVKKSITSLPPSFLSLPVCVCVPAFYFRKQRIRGGIGHHKLRL